MASPDQHRILAALSYVGILFLIPLFGARDSEFAQFHAKQGLVLFAVSVLISFIAWIPFVGWSLAAAAFIVAVYAFFQAIQGVRWEIPYLGSIAAKLKI